MCNIYLVTGSGDINIHDKNNSSETVKSQLFLFENLIMVRSNLGEKDQRKVPELAATMISYDHGFRQVRGANELGKTWTKRLEAAFEPGADTHPPKARHKGSVAYTNKLRNILVSFTFSIIMPSVLLATNRGRRNLCWRSHIYLRNRNRDARNGASERRQG